METKLNGILTLLIVFIVQVTFAQEKEISGTVQDEDGVPLAGVNITIVDGTGGTSTDLDGNYKIDVEQGDALRFSIVGFEDQTQTVGDENTLDVTMKEGTELDEVVVTGYGTQRKSDVTSSISKISSEDMADRISPSFESNLAGRASGVQVSTPSVIGESPQVNIRGIASINSGTQPLYVVDGIPYNSSPGGANMDVNPLADLNPNDIESFEVLKDGAASAIYGSRAANGVVLITTKKGEKDTFTVNISSKTGFGEPMKKYKLLGTDDFVEVSNEKAANAGEDDWAAGTDYHTNWQDEVLRSHALQIDENISISGGSDKGTYYISAGYKDQEGASIDNKSTKYNLRANVDQDITDWLEAGASIAYTQDHVSAMNKGSNALSGHMFNALQQPPNIPIYDEDDKTGYNISDDRTAVGRWDNPKAIGADLPNIMHELDNNTYRSKRNRTVINGFAEADIVEGLSYRLQIGYDYGTNHERMFWNPHHGDGRSENGILDEFNFEDQLWNVQNILTYKNTFNDVHNIDVTGVAEFQQEKHSYVEATGEDMASETFNDQIITDAFNEQSIGGHKEEQGLKSFIGRARYNYDERYYAEVSFRHDGLSNLDESNRWQSFWGGSAGWKISNEEFWDSETISNLELRGSYAQTGNTQIGTYPYLGLYSLNKYGNQTGVGYSQFGNAGLVWETTNKMNVGLDLAFLHDRIRFTGEYFQNKTKDMIMNQSTAPTLGLPDNLIKINAGDMKNSGVEFSVDANIFNKEDFSWDTGFNISYSKNKIENLPGGDDIFPSLSDNPTVDGNIIIREGESINSLYGHKYHGVNEANGMPVYEKEDGALVQANYESGGYSEYDPDNPEDMSESATLGNSDRQILGQTEPKYFGGWHNTLRYKDFDLSFMFRFSGGNKIYNSTRHDLLTQDFLNNLREIKGRWQSPDNPGDGKTPKLQGSNDGQVNGSVLNSRFVENGRYISLDNLTLGYNFAEDLVDNIGLKKLRLYISGQNLFMITGYSGPNPEGIKDYGVDEYTTPKTRIYTLGVNISL